MKTTTASSKVFENVNFDEAFKDAPTMTLDELDALAAAEETKTESTESSKAKKAINWMKELLAEMDTNEIIANVIISIIACIHMDEIDRSWKFEKHSKLSNLIFTGATSKNAFSLVRKFTKGYSLFNMVADSIILVIKSIIK